MALDFSGRTAIVLGDGAIAAAVADRLGYQGAAVLSGAPGAAMVAEAAGTLDSLVIVLDPPEGSTLPDLDEAEIAAALDRQLNDMLTTVRDAIAAMRESGHGRLVVCVPSAGIFGSDRSAVQCVVGGAAIALTKGIATANLDRDIRANVVSFIAATTGTQGLFRDHPVLLPELFRVEAILPAITYLAHRSCALTGEVISAGAGRFAKVVTSVALGGFDPAVTDDSFAALLPSIMDTRSTFSPRTVVDELITIAV